MKVRANSSMKALLGAHAEAPEDISAPCPPDLLADLRDGFKEVQGCIVPKGFEGGPIWSATRPRVDNQDDETGFECSLSKVHIEDFAKNDLPLADMTRLGIAYALCLRDALLRSFESGVFRIIVDAQLRDAELELNGSVCTVRYHRVRTGQVWLTEDLDGYKMNAVLAIEFDAAEH